MKNIIKDPLIVMPFLIPEGEEASIDIINNYLIERRAEIEGTFKNDEYIKVDLTNQELIGIKSTSKLGPIKITDYPALGIIIKNSDKYKGSKILNIGPASKFYKYIESKGNI